MKEITMTPTPPSEADVTKSPKRRGNRATRVPQILEISLKIFAEEGNAGFTQRRVASEAGIRLSTLQHYFRTREDLIQATMDDMARKYLELYRGLAKDKVRSPEARLEAIIDEVFSMLEPGTSVSAFALEWWAIAEREAFARDLMAEISGAFVEMFSGLVAKINPNLTAGECTMRGALLMSHMQGLVVFVRRAGDSLPDIDAFRTAIKVDWRTLATRA